MLSLWISGSHLKKYMFKIQMCVQKAFKILEKSGKIREFCQEQNVETMYWWSIYLIQLISPDEFTKLM